MNYYKIEDGVDDFIKIIKLLKQQKDIQAVNESEYLNKVDEIVNHYISIFKALLSLKG